MSSKWALIFFVFSLFFSQLSDISRSWARRGLSQKTPRYERDIRSLGLAAEKAEQFVNEYREIVDSFLIVGYQEVGFRGQQEALWRKWLTQECGMQFYTDPFYSVSHRPGRKGRSLCEKMNYFRLQYSYSMTQVSMPLGGNFRQYNVAQALWAWGLSIKKARREVRVLPDCDLDIFSPTPKAICSPVPAFQSVLRFALSRELQLEAFEGFATMLEQLLAPIEEDSSFQELYDLYEMVMKSKSYVDDFVEALTEHYSKELMSEGMDKTTARYLAMLRAEREAPKAVKNTREQLKGLWRAVNDIKNNAKLSSMEKKQKLIELRKSFFHKKLTGHIK